MRITLLLLFALSVSACRQAGAGAAKVLNANAFEKVLAEDRSAQLVDVRTAAEFANSHLNGAKLISINEAWFAEKIGQLDKNRPALVYCASGSRSAAAADQMTKMGFKTVYDLEGGINAWRATGKQVVR